MAYTAGFSVNVGDPTKASDVTTLAANDDFLKAAVDAIMADSATPSSTLKATVVLADGVTATTQSAGNNTTRVATTAFVKTAVDASSTSPAGSNTQIQYNDSGSFGASANLTFDGSTLINAGQGIGVGEAPSTWSSGFDYVQIGGTLALASQPGVQASQAAWIVQNAHYDSDNSWEYQATDEASRIGMSSGNITFDNAASGTAGSDITWSERMRIDSNGHIAIGRSSYSSRLIAAETSDSEVLLDLGGTHASYASTVLVLDTTRTGNSGFNMALFRSNDGNDDEFKFRGDGNGYCDGSWSGSGADYQEFFESSDGSALEVGKSVVMDGDKVRVYNASSDSTDNIIGVVRPKADNKNSAVIGNTAWNHWTDKYLTDDWGVYLREGVTVWEWDEVRYAEGDDIPEDKQIGDVKIEAGSCYERDELAKDPAWTAPTGATSSTQSVRKRNPDYDESQAYAPREERDEWNLIGLLGQVQIKANEPTRPTWIKMKQISDSVDLWLVR